jgi:glycine cleavage system transcriptional repressor
MEHWLMLTLVGKDRSGIVAKISQVLFGMQGILGDTSMIRLGDNFTIMLLGASKNLIFPSNLF